MNGGLISREDLLEAMNKLHGVGGIYLWNPEEVLAVIEKSPAVEAELVVHAHWELRIDEDEDWGDLIDYKCSACGKSQFNEYDYCPNCGAHMDEEVADE